eukprot:3789512-Amphidinium_carterae.1
MTSCNSQSMLWLYTSFYLSNHVVLVRSIPLLSPKLDNSDLWEIFDAKERGAGVVATRTNTALQALQSFANASQ